MSKILISVISPTIRPQGLEIMRESLMNQTFKDFEWLVDINITGEHDLNKSFNSMIKRAEGELIVFYEDFTKITPDGLQKFWDAYQKDKRTLFTAPLGKVTNFEDQPRWDWRMERKEINWNEVELDWGAIPKYILYDIGGFDERLDQWWSYDNVSVGLRANLFGYKFANVQDNLAVAIDHDAIIQHPFREKFNPPEVLKLFEEYNINPRLNML